MYHCEKDTEYSITIVTSQKMVLMVTLKCFNGIIQLILNKHDIVHPNFLIGPQKYWKSYPHVLLQRSKTKSFIILSGVSQRNNQNGLEIHLESKGILALIASIYQYRQAGLVIRDQRRQGYLCFLLELQFIYLIPMMRERQKSHQNFTGKLSYYAFSILKQ